MLRRTADRTPAVRPLHQLLQADTSSAPTVLRALAPTCPPPPAPTHPPGAPTVLSAGPELPADATNMTSCLRTSSVARSMKRPALGEVVGSPYDMLIRWAPGGQAERPGCVVWSTVQQMGAALCSCSFAHQRLSLYG